MPRVYNNRFSNSLENEIGNIYDKPTTSTDPRNSGPLWYGDPLTKGTHIRNPGTVMNSVKMTNKRFSNSNSDSFNEISNRRVQPNARQKQSYYNNVFKNSKSYYSIPNRYVGYKTRSQIQTRNDDPGSRWYQNAIDWIHNPVGPEPDICRYESGIGDEASYYCVTLHSTDESNPSATPNFKDLNSILCGMDSSYCVIDYCHPHCNSWFEYEGTLVNQDCGRDGCGNQCGAWHGTTSDGCAPDGYNGWNYWSCASTDINFTDTNGDPRKRSYCYGHQHAPGPSSCFIKGTEISMADGSRKPIEKVEVGDMVKTYNEETENIENNKVLSLQSPIREGYFELRHGKDNKLLGITDEHPLYSARDKGDGITEMGWRSIVPESTISVYPHLNFVGKLNVGDFILDDELKWHKVNSIDYIKGDIQTYNLWNVENTNTFFAGGVLAHNRCFITDTMILTPDGEKPIQDIRLGDIVLGYAGDEIIKNKVLNLMVHEIGGDLIKVYTRKGHITGTKNHPLLAKTQYFDYKKEIFTDIENLSIGDYLLDANGGELEIISIEDISDEQVTYNLEIEGTNRTYIANGYRVHNARIPKSPGKYGKSKVKYQYPNRAIHPLKNPKKMPWVFYDLGKCELDYIFGYRKTPCPGDSLPAELSPEKTLENVLGTVPGHIRSNPQKRYKWLMSKYLEKHNKFLSDSDTTLDTIDAAIVDSPAIGLEKIAPPDSPQ